MSIVPSRLPADEVRATFLDPADDGLDAVMWAMLLRWLQPDERARFDRFRHPDARASFLLGRGLARTVLSDVTGVPPAEWRFVEGLRGRPEIASPETTLRFNLAHSGGVVVCVLADGRDVGVDVEHLDRPTLSHDVAARSCAEEELADIASEPACSRQQRFLVYWTLKEAYLKARGLGISVHLPDVTFSIDGPNPRVTLRGSMAGDDTAWTFGLAQPSPRHIMAVAAACHGGVAPTLRFEHCRAARFSAAGS
jgi:4'-phosphopantetheinyl transferase